jgi:heme A synthase
MAIDTDSPVGYIKGLHRYVLFLAMCTLLLILAGACVTSETRALPGSTEVPPPTSTSMLLEQTHFAAGIAMDILTAGLAVWLMIAERRSWVRLLGGIASGAVVVESLLGRVPVLHALLAPVLFSLMVAIALFTSKGWAQGPEPADCRWRPSLRSLGILMPILAFMQIGLGAAYRHNTMGVLSHILNALIVLLFTLVVGVFVMRQYPQHRSLHPAAHALVVITSVQVLLGFTVFLVLIMSSRNNVALVVASVAHVVNGSLALAAAVVMVIQIRRHLRDVAPPTE